MAKSQESVVEIQGKQLRLSNLDKVLYPQTGFTKAQVIDYYVRVAPVLLPHLRDRPLTMKRYPEGVEREYFYEKNCPAHRPPWVKTAAVWSEGNRRWMDYCVVQDLPTLVWAANLADLELHTSLSLGQDILCPTTMVFDLDPGAPANVVQCCEAALWLRGIFGQLGLQSFAKTSGSKGLQVYVPLNTPVSYDETKAFAYALARLLQTARPDLIVADMKKSLRAGKVFVDWSQNDDHKTTVCVYSLRAKEHPTVSTPVAWDEVEECREKQESGLLVFVADQVLERIESSDDLFGAVLELKQKLPPLDTLGQISLSQEKAMAPAPAKPPKRKSVQAARAGRKRAKAAGAKHKHAA